MPSKRKTIGLSTLQVQKIRTFRISKTNEHRKTKLKSVRLKQNSNVYMYIY